MSTNDILTVSNILDNFNQITDIDNLTEDIKTILSQIYDISEVNLLYYDEKTERLKNISKNFEPIEDFYSQDKTNTINNIFSYLKTSKFVINDDTGIDDNELVDETIISKTVSVGLKNNESLIGVFRLKFRNKQTIKEKDLKLIEILSYNISLKTLNAVLSYQLATTTDFYKSLKDISKITENQYDFQYIIPLIGEIIDKFVMNHLIYIFIKQDDKFNLYWPSACWNKKIYELINTLTSKDTYKLSDDKRTGIFTLVSENEITGCIVAHSITDALTEEEIYHIQELTSQSAITIERANTYSEMLENATTDALTGLNNRRQFEVRLKEQYAIANRQLTPLCAIMTDIDYFKKFNDTYGHSIGDEVLKTVANTIKSQLREYDIPSRYGGEEFCILLPQTDIEEAKIVAERLRDAVEKTELEISKNKKLNITISVGLAQLDINDMPDDLYIKADRALYTAKEEGRNNVKVYNT